MKKGAAGAQSSIGPGGIISGHSLDPNASRKNGMLKPSSRIAGVPSEEEQMEMLRQEDSWNEVRRLADHTTEYLLRSLGTLVRFGYSSLTDEVSPLDIGEP
ncbi:hypothetical protein M434DRAFT_36010 [Hypoxylon sp. CO27-5]|nr:hypothetical protein M434DRAFT_36010 [Hypoxylon sp. CO27-5]